MSFYSVVLLSVTYLFFPILLLAEITPLEPDFCDQNRSDKTIFCLDFQDNQSGLYTSEQLTKDWPNLQSLSTKLPIFNLGVTQQRVEIVDNKKQNGNHMFKIKYPKDKFGSWQSGATWTMKFPQNYEKLSFEYKVMFKKGFLYTREGLFGGKLPGLMGGETISGGATATGRNGWTSRLMWGQMGRGLGYLYYPDMKDDAYNQKACPRYGLEHELCVIKRNKYFTFDNDGSKKCLSEWAADEHEFRFDTEHFYKVKQQIKMNTIPNNTAEGSLYRKADGSLYKDADGSLYKDADGSLYKDADGSEKTTRDSVKEGNRDGELKIWLDDKLVVDCDNIRFRDVPELAIDSLIFSTFFGGNTPESSAHPHDEYIYFDDFLVSF